MKQSFAQQYSVYISKGCYSMWNVLLPLILVGLLSIKVRYYSVLFPCAHIRKYKYYICINSDSIADGDTIIRESVGFLCRDDTDAPIA